MKKTGVMLTFIFLLSCISSGAVINGTLNGLNPQTGNITSVTAAAVRLNGTAPTQTTDSNGQFSIDIQDNSAYILSLVKTGYAKTYTVPHKAAGTVNQSVLTLTNTDLGTLYGNASVTPDATKGTLIVSPRDTNGNPLYGATGIFQDINGNAAAQKIMYWNNNTNSLVNSPGAATNLIIGFNIKPGIAMVSASSTGITFIWRHAFIFADCITSGVSQPDGIDEADGSGDVTGLLLDETGNPVAGATILLLGRGDSRLTDPNGKFTLSSVPYTATSQLLVEASEPDTYVCTYNESTLNETTISETMTDEIMGAVFVSTLSNDANVTLDPAKGILNGQVRDIFGNPVNKISISVPNEDATAYDTVYYENSEGTGIDSALTQTSDTGDFVDFNVLPQTPAYIISSGIPSYAGFTVAGSVTVQDENAPFSIGHLVISPGPANPPASPAGAGSTSVPMLHIQINETTGYEPVLLNSITITDSGIGDDVSDVSVAKAWTSDSKGDLNTLLTSGTFTQSDGTLTFSFSPAVKVSSDSIYYMMVTYDFLSPLSSSTFQTYVAHNSDVNASGQTSLMPVSTAGAPVYGNTMTIHDLVISESQLDFSSNTIGLSWSQSITVSNKGPVSVPISIGQLTITDANSPGFSIINDNVSNTTLDGGQSATVSVNFAPSSVITYNANLNIPFSDPNTSVTAYTVPLTGSGLSRPAGSGSSSCFIATAAFGSPLAKQIEVLREFRDKYLLTSYPGKKFVSWYYRNGPIAARFIQVHSWLKAPVRMCLYPLIIFAWVTLKGILIPAAAMIILIVCFLGVHARKSGVRI